MAGTELTSNFLNPKRWRRARGAARAFFIEGIPVSRFREGKFRLTFRCGVPAERRVQPLRVPARQPPVGRVS